MEGVIIGLACWVLAIVAFAVGRMTKPSSTVIDATQHDVGLLPGGQVIHYSTCWCRHIAPCAHGGDPAKCG